MTTTRKELLSRKYQLMLEQEALNVLVQRSQQLALQHSATCDVSGCHRSAVAFDAEQTMFVCDRHQHGEVV